MDIKNKLKNTISTTLDTVNKKVSLGTEKIYEALGSTGIDRDVLSDLAGGGGILIKSSLINEKIEEAIRENDQVSLNSFNVEKDGIHLNIAVSKSFIKLNLDIVILIKEFRLNKVEQSIICNIRINKSKGNKFLDIIIKPIIEAVLSVIIKNNIDKVDIIVDIDYLEGNESIVTIDVSNIKRIKLLLVSLPLPMFQSITPIELLAFDNFIHSSKGITVKGRIIIPSL